MCSEQPLFPWLHIGDCPICGDGLCRVRCCTTSDGERHLYALCDECETIWLEPTTSSEPITLDAEDPKCPFTNQDLFGAHSRWATTEDIRSTAWESETIVELPMTLADGLEGAASEVLFVTNEDLASPLDVPTLSPPGQKLDDESLKQSYTDDSAYGQDEPRPGC